MDSFGNRLRQKNIYIVPLFEAALIAVIALAGWLSHSPLVFASLGPTAFELIETPERPSARPYNVIVGNIIAIVAAFIALWLTGAGSTPSVSAAGVPLLRVWAATFAAMLTAFGTLLLEATQPAALSTTLLIALGIMQTGKDAGVILVAILLMTAIGEPIRRWRVRGRQRMHSRAIQ
jgi:CBS-domain-containing membrane protein